MQDTSTTKPANLTDEAVAMDPILVELATDSSLAVPGRYVCTDPHESNRHRRHNDLLAWGARCALRSAFRGRTVKDPLGGPAAYVQVVVVREYLKGSYMCTTNILTHSSMFIIIM